MCPDTHHSHKRKESVSMAIPQQLELTTQRESGTGSRQEHRLPELHQLKPVLGKCLVDLQPVWYFIVSRLCLEFLAAQVRLKMSQKLSLFIDKILSLGLFFSTGIQIVSEIGNLPASSSFLNSHGLYLQWVKELFLESGSLSLLYKK